MTESDESSAQLLLVWRIGRLMYASSDAVGDGDISAGLLGFSAFCGMLYEQKQSSNIAYLPLIPESLTDHMILQEKMKRLVKTSIFIGNEWTVICGDQATYELATIIREKNKQQVSKWSYFWVGSMKHIIT